MEEFWESSPRQDQDFWNVGLRPLSIVTTLTICGYPNSLREMKTNSGVVM